MCLRHSFLSGLEEAREVLHALKEEEDGGGVMRGVTGSSGLRVCCVLVLGSTVAAGRQVKV